MDRRRELKQQYKQTPTSMGVYQMRNLINGKIWVSSSMNLHGAANRYRFSLPIVHQVKALQDDWNQYGGESFVFEILETLDPDSCQQEEWKAMVALMEEAWKEKLQPYGDKGYNTPGGKY